MGTDTITPAEMKRRIQRFNMYMPSSSRIRPGNFLSELYDLTRERYLTLEDNEAHALYDWARDEAKLINTMLRAGAGEVDLSVGKYLHGGRSDVSRLWIINILDRCMTALPEAMTLYRGTDHFDALEGDEWIEHAFTSATWDINVAKRFARGHKGTKLQVERTRPTLVHIELPAGTPVCAVGLTPGAFRREAEIVIARSTRFEVTDRRDLRGLQHVHVRAVS